MSRSVGQKQIYRDNVRFKLHKLNVMKTTFYINMQKLKPV